MSAGGAGNKIDASLVQVADISKTSSCRLTKFLREGLKKHNILKGVKVVFSTEMALEPKRRDSGRPINGTIS